MSNWMIPYSDLDQAQTPIVDLVKSGGIRSNLWLVGYPGSGKSVVLTHIAQKAKENHSVAIVTYTRALGDLFSVGYKEIAGRSGSIPVFTPYEFLNRNSSSYDYVICDEIQDLSLQTLQEIKNRCTHLIAAGDANQSIYTEDNLYRPVMRAGQAREVLEVEPIEQNTIYRLTRSIVNIAVQLCPSMSGMNNKVDATKIDVNVIRRKYESLKDECRDVYERAKRQATSMERTSILFSTHQDMMDFVDMVMQCQGKRCWSRVTNRYGKPDFSHLNSHISSSGIKMQSVLNGYGSLEDAHRSGQIILTTYASAKGLDFENVYLPMLRAGIKLKPNDGASRTLLMVAMTRSSKNLTMSYSGRMSDYISDLPCTDVSPLKSMNPFGGTAGAPSQNSYNPFG